MARYINAENIPTDEYFKGLTDIEKAKVIGWLLQSPTISVGEIATEALKKFAKRLKEKGQIKEPYGTINTVNGYDIDEILTEMLEEYDGY